MPCSLVVNGRRFRAMEGDTLVDAALSARILIPQDCCTGQCETCRVRIYAGEVDDHGTRLNDTVLACQATVTGEAVIEFDEVPAVVNRAGTVTSIRAIAPDILEVVIALLKPLTYLAGQYVKLAFAGYPSRDYSPTLRLDGSAELNELVFQIRREPDGIVSSQLGDRILERHRVRVRGPFGHAFHRRDQGRLVLVSTGTGFAPIWAIARAARFKEPDRELVLIAGARHAANLYMREPVEWLLGTGVQRAILTASQTGAGGEVRAGRPTQHLPRLTSGDMVFAAGAPEMVASVEFLAEAAGSTCYGDPYYHADEARRWRHRLLQSLKRRFRRNAAGPRGANGSALPTVGTPSGAP